jgi:hypothetical protein
MRRQRYPGVVAVVGLLTMLFGCTAARAQSVDELKQRIQELERSTRDQVEQLRRIIQEQEAQRAEERRAQEQRERAIRILGEEMERQRAALAAQEDRVGRFLSGWENFFDLQAGRKQSNNDPNPLGKDIQGNVYSSDRFKIRLGGSLRLHVQHNDTPVGESVSSALLPDTTVPGGGNNADRENFRAFAGRTRINLAIEGPETLGGKTQGFFEFDFNRQFSSGEGGAINNNPRLRHAFGRWRFPDLLAKGDELVLTLGQTTSFADNVPDTVDFNTMLGGLGAALRRNPRFEILHRYPLTGGLKFVSSVGFERPFFGNDFIGTDLGPGDLSGFPAVSGGIGLEAGRLGQDFGIGDSKIYVRSTWGEFQERFTTAAIPVASFGAQTNFRERDFTNQTVHGTVILDRIGFNRTGRALTLKLQGGGVWARGDALHLNSEFGPRIILDDDGRLTAAQSAGGWINPIFFITDTLSIRWAGGIQHFLDDDRPVLSGAPAGGGISSNTAFFRTQNRQSELSLWWTPGPFTFAIAWNHTFTRFKHVNLTAPGSESRENENNKIEFISWFSF